MQPDDASSPSAWLRIACSELAAAAAESPGVLPGTRCHLAQQAAEKAIKAVYAARGAEHPRIHEIHTLLAGLDDVPPEVLRAAVLSDYIVSGRYPDDLPDAQASEADEAITLAQTVIEWAQRESA